MKLAKKLLNEGAELDTIPDSEHFDISAKVAEFKKLKGEFTLAALVWNLAAKAKARHAKFPQCPICSKRSSNQIKF